MVDKKTTVKRKCEWEQLWDIDEEEGREIRRGSFSFLILQSASPPPPHVILLVTPHKRGVVCVVIWLNQGWAVAAGSWALATYVLQLQPELWRLGNGSQPNYSEWLPVCWCFSDGDRCVRTIRGGGPFLIGLPNSFSAWEQRERAIWLVGEKRDVSWFGKSEPMPEMGEVAPMVHCM